MNKITNNCILSTVFEFIKNTYVKCRRNNMINNVWHCTHIILLANPMWKLRWTFFKPFRPALVWLCFWSSVLLHCWLFLNHLVKFYPPWLKVSSIKKNHNLFQGNITKNYLKPFLRLKTFFSENILPVKTETCLKAS